MNVRLMTTDVSRRTIIGVAFAATIAAVILQRYSNGWLFIPVVLSGGSGVAIQKMQR
jgi:hypothetical protein